METLLRLYQKDEEFQSTAVSLKEGLKEQMVAGLTGSARMLYVASLYRETRRPVLLVTHNLNQAQKAVEDLYELLPKDQVLLYPANELVATEIALDGHETLGERVQVLSRLSKGFSGVFVVPFAGLRKLVPPAHVFSANHRTLKVGEVHPVESLIDQLVKVGFERVEMVEKPGNSA